MNIRNLECLVALAKYRHFQRAAEACNVSQPTLSAQLRKLENELGLQLLERTTRKIHFSQSGLRLVEQTQVILREIEALKNMANSQDSLSRTLDIGIIPTLAPYMFSHINTICREHFPEAEIEIYEAQTKQLVAMLESGVIECAIVAASKETSKYIELQLFEEPIVLGVGHKHPFAKLDEINMDHLKNNKILMLNDVNDLHNQVLRYCYQFELEPDRRFIGMHLETLSCSVALNNGLAFFPLLSTHEKYHDEVKYLRCVAPELTRKIVLVFNHRGPMRNKYELLRNRIAQHMKEYFQE